MRVEDDRDGTGSAAHAGWAPPEHYTPSGERRAEPPGPVATEGHYDTGPAEQSGTSTEEAALDDVDGGEFPPDRYPGDGGTPVDEVSAGAPAVGVAHVPSDGQVAPTDAPEQAPNAEVPQLEQVPAPAGEPPAENAPPQTAPPAETAPPQTAQLDTAEPDTAQPDPAEAGLAQPDGAQLDTAQADTAQPGVAETDQPETAAAEPGRAGQADEVRPEDTEAEPATDAATPDRAREPEPVPAADELAPGEVPTEVAAAFWQIEVVDGFRDRWQSIQLRFIDDPRRAAEQAQTLVTDVIQGFTDAVNRQRDELDRWQGADLDDTEELRVTVRRYRDLLDRLLAL